MVGKTAKEHEVLASGASVPSVRRLGLIDVSGVHRHRVDGVRALQGELESLLFLLLRVFLTSLASLICCCSQPNFGLVLGFAPTSSPAPASTCAPLLLVPLSCSC